MMILPCSRSCWCGNTNLSFFNIEYGLCAVCGTLVSLQGLSSEQLKVINDDEDFYGKQYWLDHQKRDLGFPDIRTRARNDLTERNLHWLKTLLTYRLPPTKVLELGCSHGSFVALLRQAGYDASGVEMSPWVVEFGKTTFDVPISVGPVEALALPSSSLDVITLMDVLEHLPDPATTMAHCLQLLKPDGLLLIQTPQFKEGMNYTALVETKGAFLQLLKADEHLYLFSNRAVTQLFQRIGAKHVRFDPAIFGHYDMFFAVSRVPFATNSTEEIEAVLTATPQGRLTLALLDIYARESEAIAKLIDRLQASEADRSARLEVIEEQGRQLAKIPQLEAEKAHLIGQLQNSEADRAARLEVIEGQGRQLAKIPQLEAEKAHLIGRLQASEADRAARLEVIEEQGRQLDSLQCHMRNLRSQWLVKALQRVKLVSGPADLSTALPQQGELSAPPVKKVAFPEDKT